MQNFPDFAQNLEIFMRKLRMYAFTPLYNVIIGMIFALYLAQKFQKLSFDRTKFVTFRMSGLDLF